MQNTANKPLTNCLLKKIDAETFLNVSTAHNKNRRKGEHARLVNGNNRLEEHEIPCRQPSILLDNISLVTNTATVPLSCGARDPDNINNILACNSCFALFLQHQMQTNMTDDVEGQNDPEEHKKTFWQTHWPKFVIGGIASLSLGSFAGAVIYAFTHNRYATDKSIGNENNTTTVDPPLNDTTPLYSIFHATTPLKPKINATTPAHSTINNTTLATSTLMNTTALHSTTNDTQSASSTQSQNTSHSHSTPVPINWPQKIKHCQQQDTKIKAELKPLPKVSTGLNFTDISNLKLNSVSARGVELKWDCAGECSDLKIDILEIPSRSNIKPIIKFEGNKLTIENLSDLEYKNELKCIHHIETNYSRVYQGNLNPDTKYIARIKRCHENDCSTKSISFTTDKPNLVFNDARSHENHLFGDLSAHVNIAQTHTCVTPSGNAIHRRPDLIMNRDALLLVTPRNNTNNLWVKISIEGEFQGDFSMHPPSALPDTDQRMVSGRPKVVFSDHAWSLRLPHQMMKPGISLELTDNLGRVGKLESESFEFAGEPELLMHLIDIGLLTTPSGKFALIDNMKINGQDYFQKIPVSKLIILDHTPLHLEKVTLPNGAVYTKRSNDTGTAYNGDLDKIARRLISQGIIKANQGVLASDSNHERFIHDINQVVVHKSRGMYKNGLITHCCNAESITATVGYSIGNEFSHELGHVFGRDHFLINASSHDVNSGWGWDAVHDRFIGNLHWTGTVRTNNLSGHVVKPFENAFRYTRDSMAEGRSRGVGTISNYTLDHPAGTHMIQGWLQKGIVKQTNGKEGEFIWNNEKQTYQQQNDKVIINQSSSFEAEDIDIDFDDSSLENDSDYYVLDFDSQMFYEPIKINRQPILGRLIKSDVPVMTVLAVHDPVDLNPSQIFPLTFSNYGKIYSYSSPTSTFSLEKTGWISASTLSATERKELEWVTLTDSRGNKRNLCQFQESNADVNATFLLGIESMPSRSNESYCELAEHLYKEENDHQSRPVSMPMQYELRSVRDEMNYMEFQLRSGSEIMDLCLIGKESESEFTHAGYFSDYNVNNPCRQPEGIKHNATETWLDDIKLMKITIPSAIVINKNCLMRLSYSTGDEFIELPCERLEEEYSNYIHVNIDPERLPKKISIIEQRLHQGKVSIKELATLDVELTPDVLNLKGPLIVGQGCE